MIKKTVTFFLLGLLFLLTASCNGCYCASDDEKLNTIPVTNNPLIVPDTASPIPGIPSSTL